MAGETFKIALNDALWTMGKSAIVSATLEQQFGPIDTVQEVGTTALLTSGIGVADYVASSIYRNDAASIRERTLLGRTKAAMLALNPLILHLIVTVPMGDGNRTIALAGLVTANAALFYAERKYLEMEARGEGHDLVG